MSLLVLLLLAPQLANATQWKEGSELGSPAPAVGALSAPSPTETTPLDEAEEALQAVHSSDVADEEACFSSQEGLGECYRIAPSMAAQVASPPTLSTGPTPLVTPSKHDHHRRATATNATLTVVHSGALDSHFLEVDKDDKECTESEKALDDCFGGAARIRFQIKVNTPGISLFAGNIYGGHIWFRIEKEPMVVDMLNSLRFDVITLGISEFYDGPRGLVHLFTDLDRRTQIVLCNADFKRDLTLAKLPNAPTRSTILTVDDLKVGVIGYIDENVRTIAQPGPTITISDPLECLRNESKTLRTQGCHIVLALGGGDIDHDRQLAESLPDVTAFVSKYKHRHVYPSSSPQPQDLNFDQDLEYPINFTRQSGGHQAYIFASTDHYQLLGKFQITVQTDTLRVFAAKGTPVLLNSAAPEDPETLKKMQFYKAKVEPEANKVIGTTKVYIDNSNEACGSGECNGGNLIADAVFDYFSEVAIAGAWSQINAAVINAGALGDSFDERVNSGELRLVDIFEMYPRSDYYVFITMRGDTLRKMIEHSVDSSPPRSKFLQVSGIRFEVVPRGPGNKETLVKNLVVLCTSCRTPTFERVIWIQWYTLVMSRYLAQGGDFYDFTLVPRGYKIETNVSDDMILRQYLKKRSPLMPMIDGRITFLSSARPLRPPQAVVLPILCAAAVVAQLSLPTEALVA